MNANRRRGGGATRGLATVAALLCACGALAQVPVDQRPAEFEGAGLIDRRGEHVPMDLKLTDHTGREVTLGEYFADGTPVLLTLNYYKCPQLCTLMLNGLVDGLNEMEELEPGKDFKLLTVSFDPREGTDLAAHKRRAYLTQYKKPGADEAWSFLTGTPEQIDTLLDAVGYSVKRDDKTGQFIHSATIVFLTPDGRVSLYMDDVAFAGKDLRLAFVEASQGRIGSPLDQFALFTCFQYDPDSNSYKVAAWKIMRSGGMLTLMVLVAGLAVLWVRELRKKAHHAEMHMNETAAGGAGGSP